MSGIFSQNFLKKFPQKIHKNAQKSEIFLKYKWKFTDIYAVEYDDCFECTAMLFFILVF